MKKKGFIIYVAIITVLFLIAAWFNNTPINPFLERGLSFIIFYCVFIAIGLFVNLTSDSLKNLAMGRRVYIEKKKYMIPVLIVGVPVLFFIVLGILGTPLFISGAYRDQLGTAETKEFTSEIQAIDVNQIPIVDEALASTLAEKKLGEKPALGSQVKLGTPTIQSVNGKLVWVVPLEHSGFFKWFNNLEGTPGYIVVSATDPKDINYVEDYKIKYQPSSYLAQNLERHVRFGKDLFSGLTDFSFELNDNGEPFWVATTYHNFKFLSLPEATGVIIVNATTGEQVKYKLEEVPNWVDRVQPKEFIENQIHNQGEFVHGVFNFSNKDKYTTSKGSAIVYNNGNCYLFTGLTSVGSDEATMGFVMVDLKTKQVIRYNISGATEEAAQKSAEGKVQNLRYTATFPLITNVNGIPTYFMTLKDKEGLIKQYAFVSVKDYTSVGTGETIQDAMRNYEQITRNNGGTDMTNTTDKNKAKGTIERIAGETGSNGTLYKIILKEEPTKIYICSYDLSDELALTMKGDIVEVEFYKTDKSIINCISFDNLAIDNGG